MTVVYNIYDQTTGITQGVQVLDDHLSPVLTGNQAAQVVATSAGLDPSVANAVTGHVPVVQWGVAGTDYSANAPAIPISGNTLLATIPANVSRGYVIIQNQSAATLQVVLDDGLGGSPTSFLVGSGGAGSQGGALDFQNEKGRIRIYGPSGSQFAARQV